MPSLGADMAEGVLLGWLKKPGDAVRKGEIIAEVETDKGVIQVESFAAGTIDRLLVEPGTATPVGAPLAIIREDGGGGAKPAPAKPAVPPSARRPAADQGEKSDRMRRAIAASMEHSKREIPHYYVSETIDMKAAMDWLSEHNAALPVAERLIYGALLLKGVALALRDYPELNASWKDGRAVLFPSIHVGAAIALRPSGLVAPALKNADKQSLSELMLNFKGLVERAKSESLRASELSDATVTVTSLGERGAESAFSVIVPPQSAIVGFGRIIEKPWVVDGHVVARPLVTATLAGDHRVSDAHRGGLFLRAVSRLLRNPAAL